MPTYRVQNARSAIPRAVRNGNVNTFKTTPAIPTRDAAHNAAPARDRTFDVAPVREVTFNPVPVSNPTFNAAPARDRTFDATPARNPTFNAAPARNPTFNVAPARDATFNAEPARNPTFNAAPARGATYNAGERSFNVPPRGDGTYNVAPLQNQNPSANSSAANATCNTQRGTTLNTTKEPSFHNPVMGDDTEIDLYLRRKYHRQHMEDLCARIRSFMLSLNLLMCHNRKNLPIDEIRSLLGVIINSTTAQINIIIANDDVLDREGPLSIPSFFYGPYDLDHSPKVYISGLGETGDFVQSEQQQQYEIQEQPQSQSQEQQFESNELQFESNEQQYESHEQQYENQEQQYESREQQQQGDRRNTIAGNDYRKRLNRVQSPQSQSLVEGLKNVIRAEENLRRFDNYANLRDGIEEVEEAEE